MLMKYLKKTKLNSFDEINSFFNLNRKNKYIFKSKRFPNKLINNIFDTELNDYVSSEMKIIFILLK